MSKGLPPLIRAVKVLSSLTMASRVLGLARDQAIVFSLGAGTLSDAFFVAFGIPNLLRRLFGEGALNAATVPVISAKLEGEDVKGAWELVNRLFNLLALTLAAAVAMGIALAPYLIRLMAWGFAARPDQFAAAVRLLRIMFPYGLLVCLAALEMGALNSFGHFSSPAAAPIALNVCMISSALIAFKLLDLPPSAGVNWIAYGVVAGGIMQVAIQMPAMAGRGWRYRPLIRPTEDVRKVAFLMIPAAFGQAITQINLMVDRLLASLLPEGSITYLYCANRLVQLPLGVFGIAISTAALPALSRLAVKMDFDGMKRTLIRALRLAYFICAPAAVGLIVLRRPIVALLFQHGDFSEADTIGTAWALLFYSLGLFSYSAVKIVSQGFYSMRDTKTPVIVGCGAMIANIALNVLLMRTFLKHGGLALATALSSTLNLLALLALLRRRIGPLGMGELLRSALRSTGAAILMGAICHLIDRRLSAAHPGLIVGVALPAGVVSYALLSLAFKSPEVREVLGTR